MEILSGKCRNHPTSKQQPGICSICLRNRLLQLADAYNHDTTFHSYTDDRFISSTSTSSSPPIYFKSLSLNKNKHVRHGSSSDMVGLGELKKSRSTATTMMGSTKRGENFWKKLLKDQVQVVLGKSMTIKGSVPMNDH